MINSIRKLKVAAPHMKKGALKKPVLCYQNETMWLANIKISEHKAKRQFMHFLF